MPDKIAIIGAGIAGATAARMLSDAGHDIVLFEKSGGTGGRLSTRRTDYGEFDHGAQYVSAKSEPFRAVMDGLIKKNTAALWTPDGKDRDGKWHVGLPGMSGLVKPLLEGINIKKRTRITEIQRARDGIVCASEEGRASSFDKVIVAIPSPQASALLRHVDSAFEPLDDIVYMPCWTSMFSFDNTIDTLPNLYRGEDTMAISWLTRNNTKPKRSGAESICAQAGAIWSRDNLELDKSDVLQLMQTALEKMAGCKLAPVYAQAHRWRYARVDRPLGKPFLASDDGALFAIGDGMLGGRVEAAFESARQLCVHLSDLH
ncbi:MAG: FAD-dependent oxidoreductase [Pseudomonadota bacterium]